MKIYNIKKMLILMFSIKNNILEDCLSEQLSSFNFK